VEGELEVIDLAGALGASVRSVARYVLVEEGDRVTAGGPLAKVRRLWRQREVLAPFAGTVQAIIEGRLFYRQEPQELALCAYVPGEVVDHYPQRGVAIRATGAIIRGIWGWGTERKGILAAMVAGPGEILTWEHVGRRYGGTILVGGMLEDPRVLRRAATFGLCGLVVGSMHPELRTLSQSLDLPVIVTEGLGRIPMADPIFELLSAHHGHLAVLAGADQRGPSGPEIIIPLETEQSKPSSLTVVRPITAGMRVRITRRPYLGVIGQVIRLLATPQRTDVGTQADCAEVRLPGGRRVLVPCVNMELFG
jgi:hypothetical protein